MGDRNRKGISDFFSIENWIRFTLEVMAYFMLITAVVFVVFYMQSSVAIRINRENTEDMEQTVINMQQGNIQRNISQVRYNLAYLSNSNLMTTFLNVQDKTQAGLIRKSLEDEIAKFIKTNTDYDQIRYIDESGMEVIRVNQTDGVVEVVEDRGLQDKCERYYFIETMELSPHEIYQSDLDLNMEHGEIEKPLKPVIRFGTKVYDDDGAEKGMVIINYNAVRLLENYRAIGAAAPGVDHLLNQEGFILTGGGAKDFAFMFGGMEDINYPNMHPEVWRSIEDLTLLGGPNQVYLDHGFLTVEEIKSFGDLGESWFAVSYVEADTYPHMKDVSILRLVIGDLDILFPYGIVLLICSVAAALIMENRRQYLSAIEALAAVDELTGAYKRDAGLAIIESNLSYALSNGMDFSVCFVDINDLKKVNDLMGHKVGDKYIEKAVHVIRSSFRESDYIIRMGGDEFLICILGNEVIIRKNWRKVHEHIRRVEMMEKLPYRISLSHGIASVRGDDISSVEGLIALADQRMYIEKKAYKDRLK